MEPIIAFAAGAGLGALAAIWALASRLRKCATCLAELEPVRQRDSF